MKKIFGIIGLCLVFANCLGQTQYVFDHIVIKVILNGEDSEANEGQEGERFYLVNASLDDYIAEVGLLSSGNYFIQLRDKKNDIFGRGIISKTAFLNNESYVIKGAYKSRFPKISRYKKLTKPTIDTIGATQVLWQFQRKLLNRPSVTVLDEYIIDTKRFQTFRSKGFDRFRRCGNHTFDGWITSYRCLDEEEDIISRWRMDTIIPTKRIIVLED